MLAAEVIVISKLIYSDYRIQIVLQNLCTRNLKIPNIYKKQKFRQDNLSMSRIYLSICRI